MKIEELVHPKIRDCPIYEPGRPIEEVARELGLDPRKIVKLASNENPLGPSPAAVQAMQGALGQLHEYPDGGGYHLRQALAKRHGLKASQIILGNGSNDVLEMVAQTYLQPGDEVVFGEYGFIVYQLAALHARAEPRPVVMPGYAHDLGLMQEAISPRTRIVFLASPNNPTGTTVKPAELVDWIGQLPGDIIFCLDEAYSEYLDEPVDLRPLIANGRRVVCFRTFSKIFGLAGLRLGYAYGPEEIIRQMERVRQPFNVNTLAQAGALAALEDHSFLQKSREINRKGLQQMQSGLQALGIVTVPSAANFVLAEFSDASAVNQKLLRCGFIVRPVAGYGLPRHLRISIGTAEQNEAFLQALKEILESK